ncbi:MAG: LamG domain-containing protein, partial [Sedimentisphaerales bacterium]|nr:LamG domain-containing protein [Sedimentisphaerales bacterium]
TLLDYASYDHVALGTDGEIFPVVVTLDLSKANAGDEIFLRFNNYMLEGGDPWPVLDNVQITSLITYVDAKDASDPNVAANTTFATGEELIAGDPGTSGSGADGLWRQRAGLANGGNIFESGGSWEADLNTEDCPRLMTSVDVTEGVYDVYVYFWADAAQWRIQASLENLDGDLPLYLAHDPNGEAALADASYFGEPVPMLAESNRNLWQVWIGRTGMTSTIDVYIDDDPNHLTGNARTWYDGIGYKPVLPSDPGIGNLTHSYTFENGTADDMIGDANGVLIGDANIVDGSLILDGLDDWMEMPGDVIDINSYNEITIEAWYTPTEGANTGFTMLASFGLSNPNATWMGVDYLMITSARGDDVSRAAISCGNYSDPWATESLVNGPEYDDGLLHHMVATVTATEIALYIDGELMGKSALSENNHIENISTAQAYLGKAPYGQDPEWAGTIDEFNIYNRALSEAEVLYLAGYRTACQ